MRLTAAFGAVLSDLLVSSRIFANFFTSEILSKGCSSQETVGRLWKSLGEGEMATGDPGVSFEFRRHEIGDKNSGPFDR